MELAKIKPHRGTLIGAGLFGFLAVQNHAGILLVLACLILVPWILYGLFVIWRKPERRRLQTGKIAIWLLVVALVGGTHWYWHVAARSDADRVVSAIDKYSEEHGAWPAQLSDAGVDEAPLKRKWMLGYDHTEGQNPFLFYANTFSPFQPYVYNFGTHEWELRPD